VKINRSGPEEAIPRVDVALVMEQGNQCSSSAGVLETNLPRRDIKPGPGRLAHDNCQMAKVEY
jgi:hypothetical protein